MHTLQAVGGGKMGEALIGGLLRAQWAAPKELAIVEKLPARRAELERAFPQVAVVAEVLPGVDAVVAVKPNDAEAACRRLGVAPPRRLLSIAAGVTTARLEAALGTGAPTAVVRAMPNTPALVGRGAAGIAAGSAAGEDDLAWAEGILGAVGVVVRVSEAQLDAVTGLSGSGPAYVFLVAEALIEAGVLAGLARDIAERLAVATLAGSAELLAASDRPAASLRADVTSPGGTTAAGLRELERAGVRAALLDAVMAATERSRQLGA
ncbi:MAG: pyrroline-5-carboxylate reductase [Acidimicrobiales bacterium]